MNRNPNDAQHTPHLFAIVSWGCAATWWIAKALNSHQDIFCFHANNNKWKFVVGQKLDGVDYMKLIEKEGIHYIAAGDIHGISRYEIQRLQSYYGDRFSFCFVVRDPISRLKSFFSKLIISPEGSYKLSDIEEVIDQSKFPKRNYTKEEKYFINACNALNWIIDELKIGGRFFRCEDLTTSPQAMLELVEHISNGKVSADLAWAEKIVKMPPIASNVKNTKILFNDWHIDTISRVVKKEAWEAYSELGYNIPDFVIKKPVKKIDKNKSEQSTEIQQSEYYQSMKVCETPTKLSDTIKKKTSYLSPEKIKHIIKKIPFLGYILWWVYMIVKTPFKVNELFIKFDNLKSSIEFLELRINRNSGRKN
jgi:hypothetical protein